MQPHGDRSNALDGAAAALTVTAHSDLTRCGSVTVMVLSWYWSHQPQGRA
jgi:hypothetical protein